MHIHTVSGDKACPIGVKAAGWALQVSIGEPGNGVHVGGVRPTSRQCAMRLEVIDGDKVGNRKTVGFI